MDRADAIAKYIELKKEFKALVLKKYDNGGNLSESEQARLDDLDEKIIGIGQFIKPEYLSEIYRKMYGEEKLEPSDVDRKIAIRASREILKKSAAATARGPKNDGHT